MVIPTREEAVVTKIEIIIQMSLKLNIQQIIEILRMNEDIKLLEEAEIIRNN